MTKIGEWRGSSGASRDTFSPKNGYQSIFTRRTHADKTKQWTVNCKSCKKLPIKNVGRNVQILIVKKNIIIYSLHFSAVGRCPCSLQKSRRNIICNALAHVDDRAIVVIKHNFQLSVWDIGARYFKFRTK